MSNIREISTVGNPTRYVNRPFVITKDQAHRVGGVKGIRDSVYVGCMKPPENLHTEVGQIRQMGVALL
jgi:hypothetical protein